MDENRFDAMTQAIGMAPAPLFLGGAADGTRPHELHAIRHGNVGHLASEDTPWHSSCILGRGACADRWRKNRSDK